MLTLTDTETTADAAQAIYTDAVAASHVRQPTPAQPASECAPATVMM